MRNVALSWTKNLSKCLLNRAIVEHRCNRNSQNVHYDFCSSPFVNNGAKLCDNFVEIGTRSFGTTSVLSKAKNKGEKKKLKAQRVDENELGKFIAIGNLTSKFQEEIDNLKANFVKHLTLRSAAGSIEKVSVTFDGREYELQELVEIARKPKVVVLDVAAFPQAIPQILTALSKCGLNLNPQQDGTTIFVPLPKITREHRESLSKNAKALYIKSRDAIKDVRSKEIKKLKNQSSLSEDDCRRAETQIVALGEQYIKEAEELLDTKQKELLSPLD